MAKISSRPPELKTAIADLQLFSKQISTGGLDEAASLRLAQATAVVLAAAAGSFGECRKAVPFETIRPVILPGGGMRWCCNHDPEHCEPAP
jgi:hypothetical protein